MAEENEKYGQSEVCPALLRENIRYLVGRRLTRDIRGDEARSYYPAQWLASFDALVQALGAGWDESLPAEQRAQALFRAAFITRTNGMELLGTEVEPDWHIHDGQYQEGVTVGTRRGHSDSKVLAVGQDELRRASENHPDPEQRFHYRYQAASLAWEAAKLMPNNSDETARVLYTAGCWLKNRDPQTADIFYKALVRRNRKTVLGDAADRQRWFPELDENGNPVPKLSPVEIHDPAPDPEASTESEPENPADAVMAPPGEPPATDSEDPSPDNP